MLCPRLHHFMVHSALGRMLAVVHEVRPNDKFAGFQMPVMSELKQANVLTGIPSGNGRRSSLWQNSCKGALQVSMWDVQLHPHHEAAWCRPSTETTQACLPPYKAQCACVPALVDLSICLSPCLPSSLLTEPNLSILI